MSAPQWRRVPHSVPREGPDPLPEPDYGWPSARRAASVLLGRLALFIAVAGVLLGIFFGMYRGLSRAPALGIPLPLLLAGGVLVLLLLRCGRGGQ